MILLRYKLKIVHIYYLLTGMDPSLVLSSEQKANRFTKHNMRKAMTNPDLVERDDPNSSKHKEADSSEILNVVDIDPVPQYANDNANFDLNFSTYKYREAKKLGSGITCILTLNIT